MDGMADQSQPARCGLCGFLLVLALSLVGCPKQIPRVPIPGSDASPPAMAWQIYNMQTRERGEIVEDSQTLDAPAGQQYVVTMAVEDLKSGVRDVTLTGDVHFTCEQGARVEEKKFPLETQEAKLVPDQGNKVPVRASLVHVMEFSKSGCKENWAFGGGKLSLSDREGA